MSGRTNFGVSFTIISILSGCMTLYGDGMNTGGGRRDQVTGMALQNPRWLASMWRGSVM